MGSMTGKAAIVTGASSTGIGGAVARRLVAAGASLYLTSSDPEDLEQLAAECGAKGAFVAHQVHDLFAAGAAEEMVEAADESLGRIDVLINNAGMRIHKPFGEFSYEDFDRMTAVNLRAPFMASQAVVPIMRRQGTGRIIHVASQMGVVSRPTMSLYSATKAGLISLTKSMALELASDGISVNAVSPGPVATGYLNERLDSRPGALAALEEKTALGRLGEPDEVAEVIEFLATSNGDLIHGHNLIADGGYVVQ